MDQVRTRSIIGLVSNDADLSVQRKTVKLVWVAVEWPVDAEEHIGVMTIALHQQGRLPPDWRVCYLGPMFEPAAKALPL